MGFRTHNKTLALALPSMSGMMCSPLSSRTGSIVRVHRIVATSINNELFAICLERNVNIALARKRTGLTFRDRFDDRTRMSLKPQSVNSWPQRSKRPEAYCGSLLSCLRLLVWFYLHCQDVGMDWILEHLRRKCRGRGSLPYNATLATLTQLL